MSFDTYVAVSGIILSCVCQQLDYMASDVRIVDELERIWEESVEA
jgi:hypothetical protein